MCGSQQTGKFLKELGVPDHLYVSQQAVEPVCGTTDWFTIGKGVQQSCILSPCLFNFYAKYIMWSAKLDKSQAGIKIAGRKINNFRRADDTTLMEENKEELKSLLMNVHLKGNQFWIFIGRTDAEPETPILWPPDVKNWLTGKDPDAGKDWRWEEKGMTEYEMVGWHHRLNGHEFE